MKIAINCAFFQPQGGGIKEYIQNLVENLSKIDNENEYVLYVLEDYLEYAKENLRCRFRIKPMPFKGKNVVNAIIRSAFEQFFWRREEKREKWDVFHSPFFHGPNLKKTPLILTVHDMRFFRFPKTYTFLRYQFLKYAVKKSIKRAAHVITISQFTKEEIVEAYGSPREKITVIHEAINSDHFSEQQLADEEDRKIADKLSNGKFLLTVGHLEPRKNYNRLISAFEKMSSESADKPYLVIVGKKGHNYDDTLRLINANDNILYLNFVSQPLLNWLYRNAEFFVFPSFYEGFGFPPLEAATHGTISAVSNLSSIPEICGDAAVYFNPFDENDITRQLCQLYTDSALRSSLKASLETQLNKFSWRKNAMETIGIYKNITNG